MAFAANVTMVVMEATGDYWRPFYYLLEADIPVMLVNAHEAKNVPGRKTDVSDAAWLADLGAHGLVRASFVPPKPIREIRSLTRARTVITRERSRDGQPLCVLRGGRDRNRTLTCVLDGNNPRFPWPKWPRVRCDPRSASSPKPSPASSARTTRS